MILYRNQFRFLALATLSAMLSPFSLFAEEEPKPETPESGYTINYNTISIIEYIKFASKICNANFIFNEEDLQFTVTIVSDAPVTSENVMATLLQTLRIHGLTLLEQGSNLVIHKNQSVREMASLVFPGQPESPAPIVTRVFRLVYANPASVATILKPMISDQALIEISLETRQLIITDVTASVDKVAALIENLDTPHSPMQIKTFQAKFNNPGYLIGLAQQIMIPIAQGTPFILVPQDQANMIFIVSTPEMTDRAMAVLASLDTPPAGGASAKSEEGSEALIIQLSNRQGDEVLNDLKEIAKRIKMSGGSDEELMNTINGANWIKDTNSLVFVGKPTVTSKIRELIASLDAGIKSQEWIAGVTGASQANYGIYQIQSANPTDLQDALKAFAANLTKSKVDPALVQTLEGVKYIKQTNSLLFTGSSETLKRAQDLAQQFDSRTVKPPPPAPPEKTGYRIYKVQNTSGDVIQEKIDTLVKNMKAAGIKNSPLIKVLENLRYVKETNSLLITGDEASIQEAEELIAKYDTPEKSTAPAAGNFFMYKPQHLSAGAIQKSLKEIASNLQQSALADPDLLTAVNSVRYVEATNALIFTGTPDAIQKVQVLLKDIDVPSQKHAPIQQIGKTTFLLYKLNSANPTQITSSLKAIANDLKKSGAADKAFLSALNSMRYVKETNSLMFTGSEEALTKVQALVEKFDVASLSTPVVPKKVEPPGPSGPSNFFIYRPQSLSAQELSTSLSEFSDNLKMSGLNDPDLFQSIDSMRFAAGGQSLVFTGTTKSLEKVKELLQEFDIPPPTPEGAADQSIQSIDNTSFLVYKLQFHRGDEIQGALRQIARDLTNSNAPINKGLLDSINSIQWLEVTNSLLCSGDAETLTRLRELIKNLDIPLKQVFIEMLVLQTTLTNAVDFGLEWGGKLKYKDKFSGSFNNLLPTDNVTNGTFSSNLQNIGPVPGTSTPVPTDIPFSSGFDLGVIGDIIMHKGNSFLSLGSLLNAIQTDSETSVVLTPKIISQDGKTSSIFVGQNVPFAGSFISNQSANTITTSNLEYRNIGFSLNLTPVLGNSNIITMEISIDSSSEATDSSGSTFTFQAGQATGITTNQATLQTTVHVPDRHFLILSGMVNNSNTKQTAGIPCLGGIPVIGAAFTQNNNLDTMNSLVIFLRPTILNSLDEMKQLTTDQEEFFREQAGTPYLQHNYDEAMEYIKSPEDE